MRESWSRPGNTGNCVFTCTAASNGLCRPPHLVVHVFRTELSPLSKVIVLDRKPSVYMASQVPNWKLPRWKLGARCSRAVWAVSYGAQLLIIHLQMRPSALAGAIATGSGTSRGMPRVMLPRGIRRGEVHDRWQFVKKRGPELSRLALLPKQRHVLATWGVGHLKATSARKNCSWWCSSWSTGASSWHQFVFISSFCKCSFKYRLLRLSRDATEASNLKKGATGFLV